MGQLRMTAYRTVQSKSWNFLLGHPTARRSHSPCQSTIVPAHVAESWPPPRHNIGIICRHLQKKDAKESYRRVLPTRDCCKRFWRYKVSPHMIVTEREVVFDRVVFGIWPSGSKILGFDRVVPVCNRQENFKCFRYNDIPGDYLGSLASLDSGAKGDLRKVRIGVRVRARDSFQKQVTPEPLGQILIFWNHSVKY